jgi:hypothetical protein
MLKQIINFLNDILFSPRMHDSLEAYIVSGNPQTSEDVDRLEREYYDRSQQHIFENYY